MVIRTRSETVLRANTESLVDRSITANASSSACLGTSVLSVVAEASVLEERITGQHDEASCCGAVQLGENQVSLNDMWTWLEERYPTRHDRYRVIFSPLIGGTHET